MRCPFARVLVGIALSFRSRATWGSWPTTCQLLRLGGPSSRSEVVRGAGLVHQATGWEGEGRFVMVPFLERRLFGYKHAKRLRQFKNFYGRHYNQLKRDFPPQPIKNLPELPIPSA